MIRFRSGSTPAPAFGAPAGAASLLSGTVAMSSMTLGTPAMAADRTSSRSGVNVVGLILTTALQTKRTSIDVPPSARGHFGIADDIMFVEAPFYLDTVRRIGARSCAKGRAWTNRSLASFRGRRMLARVTEARSSLRAAEQRPKSSHARTELACGAVGLHKVFTEIASRLFALCHGAA